MTVQVDEDTLSSAAVWGTHWARPKDETCYENGRVIYERLREKRLRSRGIRVCLFCSEIRPEDCHRS